MRTYHHRFGEVSVDHGLEYRRRRPFRGRAQCPLLKVRGNVAPLLVLSVLMRLCYDNMRVFGTSGV